MSTHYPTTDLPGPIERCVHLIKGGTPVAEAMREGGYGESFIEADTFVESYPAPNGIRVTGDRGSTTAVAGGATALDPTT